MPDVAAGRSAARSDRQADHCRALGSGRTIHDPPGPDAADRTVDPGQRLPAVGLLLGLIVPVLALILFFGALLPSLAVGVRRLHDQNRSGLYWFIAFIPFGLMVDQWRWKVMSGEVTPEQYNQLWWELREKYQGVMAPVERSADAFDPGAKYHVPANVPYTRYFLAHILQFQFHKALCDIAGDEGPLNRCSIYGSEEAGKALNEMLEMGMSQPWQNALETLTGSPQMDASTIADYFAPLKTWLDEQNATRQCGW